MIHELKTWPAFFEPLRLGMMTFSLRKYDRPFKVGDRLNCREWDPDKKAYTGRYVHATVTHFMQGPILGLQQGWALMGLQITDHGTET